MNPFIIDIMNILATTHLIGIILAFYLAFNLIDKNENKIWIAYTLLFCSAQGWIFICKTIITLYEEMNEN